jgi:tol-pal system protein YbgF
VKLFSSVLTTVCIYLFMNAQVYAADADVIPRLDRIERLLQSQGLLDMLQQIEALQQELNAVRGEIEFQNHTLEQVKKRQRDLYTDIDQRLQGLERNGTAESGLSPEITFVENSDNTTPPLQTLRPIGNDITATAASQQAENPLTLEVVENSRATSEPQQAPEQQAPEQQVAISAPAEITQAPIEAKEELDPVQVRAQYQQAFKLLKQSQYEQAIKAFRDFLLVNPQSEISDNAQYWLGEAYYVTRQFEPALIEYNKLLENYPDSQKLTHSLLKIGFCYYEMGEIEEATIRLEELNQQHPGTTAARLAEERLKKIAREQANQQATDEAN